MVASRIHQVDLLIIGSGPVGATFARIVRSHRPQARILMIDAGPIVSAPPGEHVSNAEPAVERPRPIFNSGQHAADGTARAPILRARPGTELVFDADSDLPAYASATNVGGMGIYWTCATPRPDEEEREAAISAADWMRAVETAEILLQVDPDAWPTNPTTQAVIDRLQAEYKELPYDRPVALMPTAMTWVDDTPRRTGPSVILRDLLTEPRSTFALMPNTRCLRLTTKGGRVTGGELRTRGEAAIRLVTASAIVVAADAVRTPQLLWASGIRPAALGRYAGEHLQMLAAVAWSGRVPAPWDDDRTAAMMWLPYCEAHPFHGQIMLFDQRSGEDSDDDGDSVLGLGWLIPPIIRQENRIEFSPAETDAAGMPRPWVRYPLTSDDENRIDAAATDQLRTMRALGNRVLRGGSPRLLPRGSSLHLMGTTRAGPVDDGRSVCDTEGRVWGFENLYVGGNGVIAASTACNPTLTSVALAVRSAAAVARRLAGDN